MLKRNLNQEKKRIRYSSNFLQKFIQNEYKIYIVPYNSNLWNYKSKIKVLEIKKGQKI